ncbi:hypothetical protein K6119_01575 [Paracrocinitomix mangrovi]|uniref:toxin-antitoxin system YwqK family antitoxin n=1 Tax=Paracrocinitomix mangrovi TaxID=2862509 RepID=UPI001C8EEBFE|nr:hypothetical protein [Paracrocinitomix mangrovi]UKN02206.1 hypothetical protein K6119_01575 [Paracrocinitomix mangrovi]
MKKLLFTILFLLTFKLSFTQAATRESDTLYLDQHWVVTQKDEATYYRKTKFRPDSLLEVKDYYVSTNNLQMLGYYKGKMNDANRMGKFLFYYEDGTLSASYDFQYGIAHGEIRKYYENGNLKSIQRYDLGAQIDTSWEYYSNGQIHTIQVENDEYLDKNPSDKYKKRRLIMAYSVDGGIQVKDGNGIKRDYFLSGKVKSVINFQNGFPHGKWVNYTGRKKKKQSILHFKDGRFIKGEIYRKGKNDIFSSLSRGAHYPSGFSDLKKYIKTTTGFCKEGFKNEVEVMIHVSASGEVSFEQIIAGNVSPCQLEEIQQMVKNMPAWTPAINEGEYVDGSETFIVRY